MLIFPIITISIATTMKAPAKIVTISPLVISSPILVHLLCFL